VELLPSPTPMASHTPCLGVGMKVEQKLSDFSVEKYKWNENMTTEMEICRTET
jgi:hypothetical protein